MSPTILTRTGEISIEQFESYILQWWNENNTYASKRISNAEHCEAFAHNDVYVSNNSVEVQLSDAQLAKFWDWYKNNS